MWQMCFVRSWVRNRVEPSTFPTPHTGAHDHSCLRKNTLRFGEVAEGTSKEYIKYALYDRSRSVRCFSAPPLPNFICMQAAC
jgi:hypothetical protein